MANGPLSESDTTAPRLVNSGAEADQRARKILGLEHIAPDALPPRAELLWRMDDFAPTVPFTNPMFVPLGLSPDLGLARRAMAQLVERHQALRTRLAVRNGRAVQIVQDWPDSGLEVSDIKRRELDDDYPDDPSSPVRQFLKSTMDLCRQGGFLVRAFRDEHQGITLGFLAHGFFSDAWSSQVVLRDFRALYSALKSGEKPNLEPVAQYVDYTQNQLRALDGDLGAHLSFWQRKLAAMPPALLPYDHQTGINRRGRSYFFIRQEILDGLAVASTTHRVSLTLLLLAIFQIALARWSGQREILSAAYTADRVKAQFQNTVGFLVTNMPVCARLEPGQGFGAFLSGFAKEFYGSYLHRELSCEVYETIFQPPKPFCATVFNFVPLQKRFASGELLSLPAFDGIVTGSDGAKPAIYRDMYLGLAQYPTGLLGKLFYDTGLFSPRGMETFIGHFRHVAGTIAAEPDVRLGDVLC
jgi:hypothetical protein